MASIDLHYVDELIAVRQAQHGGGRGAPRVQGDHRIGVSINRSCIVMLSAMLQAYVEEVYKDAARRSFPALNANHDDFERYWNQIKSWGNPSDGNIQNLFLKLGVADIFHGLSWQRMPTTSVKRKLNELNQIRNKIAHGARHLTLDGNPYSLRLADVGSYRDVINSFSERFDNHVRSLIP